MGYMLRRGMWIGGVCDLEVVEVRGVERWLKSGTGFEWTHTWDALTFTHMHNSTYIHLHTFIYIQIHIYIKQKMMANRRTDPKSI